jgi:hypothetical protein
MIRKDIQSPQNYRQWQELISMSKAAKFEHNAKRQKGLS